MELPKGISKRRNRYRVSIMVDGERLTGTRDSLEAAIDLLHTYKHGTWENPAEVHQLKGWNFKDAARAYMDYRIEKRVQDKTDNQHTQGEIDVIRHEQTKHFDWYFKKLTNYFGANTMLDELTQPWVMKYQDHCLFERKYASSTINYHNSLLIGIQTYAKQRGRMLKDHMRMETQKRTTKRERYLSYEEEDSIAQWATALCHDDFRDIFTFYLNTGCRLREALFLRWRDVNFLRQTITVGLTKNGKNRTIPFDDTPVEEILEKRNTGKGKPTDKVFAGINERRLYYLWWQMRDELGFGKDVTIHTLRHTYCSRLVASGLDLRTVQQIMGHHSLEVTQGYSHFIPSMLKGVGAGLSKLRGASLEQKRSGDGNVVNMLKSHDY